MATDLSNSPVAVGQILADKYRVVRVLGVGGMGVVVEAMHLDLQKRVALKFMLTEAAAADSDSVARFVREGRAAARLQSEHVTRVMDVGRLETGDPYMVMEFLQGQDLSDVLEVEGRLPVDRAVSYVLQACEAVAEAHSNGIVHRDLKPANLFLTHRSDGAPLIKVLDFGISKMSNREGDDPKAANMTSTRTMLGSPLYMSPEQVRSAKSVDARTDIWSIGVILYELLTRESPFQADSLSGLIAAIVSDPPVPVQSRRPELPAALADVIMRCLSKAAWDRFEHVSALALALEPFGTVEDAALVARIVRMQKSAGETIVDPPRPPAPSVSEVAAGRSGEAHIVGATFDGTAKPRGSRKSLLLVVGGVVIASAIGGAAWMALRVAPVHTAAQPEATTVAVVVPEAGVPEASAPSQIVVIEPPDAALEAAADAAKAQGVAVKTNPGVKNETGKRETSTPGKLDLSERK